MTALIGRGMLQPMGVAWAAFGVAWRFPFWRCPGHGLRRCPRLLFLPPCLSTAAGCGATERSRSFAAHRDWNVHSRKSIRSNPLRQGKSQRLSTRCISGIGFRSGPRAGVPRLFGAERKNPRRCDTMFVDLGGLRSFKGSQRYPIPAGVDLKNYPSVVIWCERFSVLISPADLVPVR